MSGFSDGKSRSRLHIWNEVDTTTFEVLVFNGYSGGVCIVLVAVFLTLIRRVIVRLIVIACVCVSLPVIGIFFLFWVTIIRTASNRNC